MIHRFDPIKIYYCSSAGNNYNRLSLESGYKYNAAHRCNNWLAEKIEQLKSQGYSAGKNHDGNGGDNDMLFYDTETKRYEFGERGDLKPDSIK